MAGLRSGSLWDRLGIAGAPSSCTLMALSTQARILVMDDDELTRISIATVLKSKGFRVLEAANGKEGLDMTLKDKPALAIIDVEMPVMGGIMVIERLRALGVTIPVLVLSGRGEVNERVQGLNAGADDYLAKPCAGDELIARVRALLRRENRRTRAVETIQLGTTTVNLPTKTATVDGKTVKLSRTECSVLELLAREPGRPVSREEMLAVAWGYTYLPSTRTVDTHIWRLRKKLGDGGKEPQWIKNVPGEGYLLEPERA